MTTEESLQPPTDHVHHNSRSAEDQIRLKETYDAMRRLANSYLSNESQTVSLTPTVLVHEVYMRLANQPNAVYHSRAHFLAIASTMMRRILVDHARSRARIKRGGEYVRVNYDVDLALSKSKDADVLALEEALVELTQLDSRQGRIVEMKFFGGMTIPEVAEVLGVSTRTIESEWKMSRAWLRKRLDNLD